MGLIPMMTLPVNLRMSQSQTETGAAGDSASDELLVMKKKIRFNAEYDVAFS